jgi:gas vesicle protein
VKKQSQMFFGGIAIGAIVGAGAIVLVLWFLIHVI